MAVPPYSLILPSVDENLHKLYAYHLFMSAFTLPAKDASWFLSRNGSMDRAYQLDDMKFLEHACSINTALQYLSFDLNKCIQWAFQLWHTVFIANVKAANKELGEIRRYPASKRTHRHNLDFVSTATLLMTKMINLKDGKGQEFNISVLESKIAKLLRNDETYQVKEVPIFKKLNHFTDLAYIKMPPLTNYLKHPDKLSHMTIHPIDPFSDDQLFLKFYRSSFALRNFNFTNNLLSVNKLRPLFKTSSFLWASRFTRII